LIVETQSVVILDFGSQYSQLIARRVRELSVFAAVLPCNAPLDEIRSYNPVGIILSGGPCSVYDADAPLADERVLALGVPVLGICYGLQYIAHKLGGKVRAAEKREYGHAEVTVERPSRLFADLPATLQAWMSHGDEALELPSGFVAVAQTSNALAAMEDEGRRIFAVQFHPEVHHTPLGKKILRNFVLAICGARPDWTPARFIESTIAQVRETVGQGHAICALSCGVDSAVAAVLADRALRVEPGIARVDAGDPARGLSDSKERHAGESPASTQAKSRLTCVFVNNGVLRKDEFTKVRKNLRERLGLNVVAVDASGRFLERLAGVTEPERKRKIIGNEFIAVFDDAVHHLMAGDIPHNANVRAEGKKLVVLDRVDAGDSPVESSSTKPRAGSPASTQTKAKPESIEYLVQGTLYPDVIESRSVRGPSQTIKTHHNVGGLPETMKLKLIEPLKDLFKDEVRRIGRDLGMPEEMLQRQPFPGPGLAVRILGEVTPERIALLQEADDIVVSEIKHAGLYERIWQSFAVLLPVMSVGVMGDQRTYAYTCAIRAVHSEDGMTADVVELPWEVLKRISTRIVNEVRGINRVVYDVTSKPPGTIEWE